MKHVLVMQGPNMNRLGRRKPEIYGRTTLAEVEADVAQRAERRGLTVEQFQSNSEGALIDWLQERQDAADAVVCNPAGLTNYGLAFRDALAESDIPVAIVHVTNLLAREEWRRNDVFADMATIWIAGMGWRGYGYALAALHDLATG